MSKKDKDLDGMAKNVAVVKEGIDSFHKERKNKCQPEQDAAFDAGDWGEYLHKCFAPYPEFYQHCYRLCGYITIPVAVCLFPLQLFRQLRRKAKKK